MSEQEKAREKQVPEEEKTRRTGNAAGNSVRAKDIKPEQPVAPGGDAGVAAVGRKVPLAEAVFGAAGAALFVVIGVAALIRQQPARPAGAPSMAPSSRSRAMTLNIQRTRRLMRLFFSRQFICDEGFVSEMLWQSWFGNNDDIP